MPAAELGSLREHKKDRSYKRREIKKTLPPRLGSPADSFLTPQLRPQLHTDPGAWPAGPGGAGAVGGGAGAGEPGPRTEAAPALTIYGRSHTLPSSFSTLLLMSLAEH